ncbi:MAG TPA: dihydrolipoamide acetyltransferase family protein [Oscillospiraceae bacterium]|nr:dihydrolipoamide acetyltransferase family protein [Oscillospiraceae bacterium]HPK34853.1 dihydrolipoamide acetyltransferase family protein [Oscillospiraceae bacterium]HPR76183.1 dihydrolipoamide acetyltransferase family protein [Oscillospiraceae bacterium]
MAIGILMPKQGITVESCILTEWKKKVGDEVKVGDVLFAYETDKASFECESTESGTMLAQFFADGDEVAVLTNVCAIGKPGEDFAALAPQKEGETAATATVVATSTPETATVQVSDVKPEPVQTVAAAGGELKVSPRAKAAAERLGIDLGTVTPSGPEGRIIERDLASVNTFAKETATTAPAAAPTPAASAPAAEFEDVKLSGVRRSIAKAMVNSLSSMAQLTHHFSFDATEIMALRAKLKASAETLGLPNITLNDIVMYAVSRTVKNHPYCNAHMMGDSIRLFKHVNLGMAVDTERGLLVPTIFNADTLSLADIAKQSKALAKEAQGGSISPDKLSGGTFTVSNLGSLGVEMFTPIINPPQTCIIGVCNLQTKVKLVNGQPVYYQAMGLSLTYDHRAVDGAPASRFMQELCRNLENFNALLAM